MVGEDIRTRAALNYETLYNLQLEIKQLKQTIVQKDREAVQKERLFD